MEISSIRFISLSVASLVIFFGLLFSSFIVYGFAGILAGVLWFGVIFFMILFAERIMKTGAK